MTERRCHARQPVDIGDRQTAFGAMPDVTVGGGEALGRKFVTVLFPPGEQSLTRFGTVRTRGFERLEGKNCVEGRRVAVEFVGGAFRSTGDKTSGVVGGGRQGCVVEFQSERKNHRPALAYIGSQPGSLGWPFRVGWPVRVGCRRAAGDRPPDFPGGCGRASRWRKTQRGRSESMLVCDFSGQSKDQARHLVG